MASDTKGRRRPGPVGIELTAGSLMGRQSVRTTFRLPQHVIDLLSIVSSQLGLKQKSLFDQLVEDRSILEQIAEQAGNYRLQKEGRRPKTFVISKNSLDALEHVARLRQMPRDVLVEVSIKRLLPVIDTEQKKQQVRKALLKDMQSYLGQGVRMTRQAEKFLGTDDQAVQKLHELMAQCRKNVADLEDLVEKGKILEELNDLIGR